MVATAALIGTSTMLRALVGLLVVIVFIWSVLTLISKPPLDSDDDLRRLLQRRIEADRQGVGIVVGLIDASQRRIVSYGARDAADATPVDGKTIFEIGSITKVFTSLVLADMVQRGEVGVDDPVSKYLPTSVNVPQRNGRVISLGDLSSHISALPRLPTNFAPKDRANPYADYSADQLYAFLSDYSLARDIGARYEYSNLGGGLLGHALARRNGTSYAEMIRTRITGPLGLRDTVVALDDARRQRLAPGHDTRLRRVPSWDWQVLEGAGAIRSTADDMLTFLAAAIGNVETPLSAPLSWMTSGSAPTTTRNLSIARGWLISSRGDRRLVWHNGGTGGYRSYMGFDAARKCGVIVLSNAALSVDDIGVQILESPALFAPTRAGQ